MMAYPTMAEVEAADREQLCRWWRFLPSPGMCALDTPDKFQAILDAEAKIMERIGERWTAAGGFTPEISKKLGWDRP